MSSLLSVSALLALGLASCSTPASGAGVSHTALRATATSTSSAVAIPTATATPIITPAPSAGWATYRDPRFTFQVPLPPDWQVASLTWPAQTDPNGFNYYIVQFFPPGPHGEPGPGAAAMAPELIEITVTLSGPFTASLAQNMGFVPEPSPVALGNQQVLLYDQGVPRDGGEIQRAAETTLGKYPMTFEMHYLAYGAWNPAVAQRDVALFLAMIKGYHPA